MRVWSRRKGKKWEKADRGTAIAFAFALCWADQSIRSKSGSAKKPVFARCRPSLRGGVAKGQGFDKTSKRNRPKTSQSIRSIVSFAYKIHRSSPVGPSIHPSINSQGTPKGRPPRPRGNRFSIRGSMIRHFVVADRVPRVPFFTACLGLRYASSRRAQSTAHGFLCWRAPLHKSTIDPRQGLFTPIPRLDPLWASSLSSLAYPWTHALAQSPLALLCYTAPARPDSEPDTRSNSDDCYRFWTHS